MPFNVDILTSLMQHLVSLVGVPAALDLARKVPHLVVDGHGTVLDYDRTDPRQTVQRLLEEYQAVYGSAAATLVQETKSQLAEASEEPAERASPPPPAIRIAVVDDHALVREGLVGLINSQPDLQVVGQAGTTRDAIAMARSVRPDIVLMDFTLPDGTGDEAARVIHATHPDIKIIFLTVHDDDERLFAAISAGAVGYVLKSVRSADLINLLRSVMSGDVALSPTIGRRILEQFSSMPVARAPKRPALVELTDREIEILRFIVEGHTNRQIADTLNLSVRTVEYHRANLTSKLGLQSRADLVRYAVEHQLVEPQDPSRKLSLERGRRR
jgi:DNA-binding NarL/FixJ family response regulator